MFELVVLDSLVVGKMSNNFKNFIFIITSSILLFSCGFNKETRFNFEEYNNDSVKSIEFFSIPFSHYEETIFYLDFLKMVEAHKDENYCIILEKEKKEKIADILKNSCLPCKKKDQCNTVRMEILVSYESEKKLRYTLCWMDKGKVSVGSEFQCGLDLQLFNSLVPYIDSPSIKMRIDEIVKVTNFYREKGAIK